MEDRLLTEIIADMETTLVNIEIALKKVKLMIEEILDDTIKTKPMHWIFLHNGLY